MSMPSILLRCCSVIAVLTGLWLIGYAGIRIHKQHAIQNSARQFLVSVVAKSLLKAETDYSAVQIKIGDIRKDTEGRAFVPASLQAGQQFLDVELLLTSSTQNRWQVVGITQLSCPSVPVANSSLPEERRDLNAKIQTAFQHAEGIEINRY